MKPESRASVIIGQDVIGVGVGALIFNEEGKFLMGLRGEKAKNERGKWEIPGGTVEWGETFEEALKREIKEEIGVEIEILELLTVCSHILRDEGQHWVSPTYICKIIAGRPQIQEPGKCDELWWFDMEEAERVPLSIVTTEDLKALRARQTQMK